MMMKNVPDAEDACQTVFRKVMERAEPFRDPEHEKAWLITTARNECRDQLKHWWRTARVEESELEQPVWNQTEDGELCPKRNEWRSTFIITKAILQRKPPA